MYVARDTRISDSWLYLARVVKKVRIQPWYYYDDKRPPLFSALISFILLIKNAYLAIFQFLSVITYCFWTIAVENQHLSNILTKLHLYIFIMYWVCGVVSWDLKIKMVAHAIVTRVSVFVPLSPSLPPTGQNDSLYTAISLYMSNMNAGDMYCMSMLTLTESDLHSLSNSKRKSSKVNSIALCGTDIIHVQSEFRGSLAG